MEYANDGILSQREKYIVYSFFGLNGYEEKQQVEIAQEQGVTRAMISQIYRRALKRLKRAMLKDGFNPVQDNLDLSR